MRRRDTKVSPGKFQPGNFDRSSSARTVVHMLSIV
jgi:hypothetical protein